MTIKELNKIKHGTYVKWIRGTEVDYGYVVNLTKSRPTAEPPLIYIQWTDGQRTDGRDDLALKHVSVNDSLKQHLAQAGLKA